MNGLQQTAPPIPPRVNRTGVTAGVYSNYTPPAYGSSMYNGFSAGSSYYNGMGAGGFGYGMGGVGAGGFSLGAPAGNTFLRTAEESSRNAFQSIESVVQAFSAVSAMFESTYYAVFNSFRAVVGVADQFYRLKNHLTRILSALAIMRFLRYLCRKLIQLLKMDFSSGQSSQSTADAWSMASHDSEKYIYDSSKRQTNWPLVMFFAVVVGGPWLIWRILSSIESINKDDKLWMAGKIDHFVAVAEHDFDGENVDEISFRRGQRITIAPKGSDLQANLFKVDFLNYDLF